MGGSATAFNLNEDDDMYCSLLCGVDEDMQEGTNALADMCDDIIVIDRTKSMMILPRLFRR
jgi:hypothetical protein